MSNSEMKLILQLEEVLRAGIDATGISLNVSYDGDNKSCELCIDNKENEVWISSNDVEIFEE